MLTFFLNILDQNPGSYVCVQLLQTLNILFENIRNETSICKYIERLYSYRPRTFLPAAKPPVYKSRFPPIIIIFHLATLLCILSCSLTHHLL